MSLPCRVVRSEKHTAAHAATAPSEVLAGKSGKAQAQPSKWGEKTRKDMLDYVTRNNDDLTIAEAAIKFGLSETTAARYLSLLAGQGLLERVSIYRMKEKT
jgi:response regulator of citrate/malate metabolism